jgi:mono/diheme cytochrome c family protein
MPAQMPAQKQAGFLPPVGMNLAAFFSKMCLRDCEFLASMEFNPEVRVKSKVAEPIQGPAKYRFTSIEGWRVLISVLFSCNLSKVLLRTVMLFLSFFFLTAGLRSETRTDQQNAQIQLGGQLIHDLGCVMCHDIDGHESTVREEAPDLSYEGEMIRRSWLRSFLGKPSPIRPAIKARMPNLRLTDREVQAITEYLSSLTDPGEPLEEAFRYPMRSRSLEEVGEILMSPDYFDCFNCHVRGERKPEGPPEDWAPDLTKVKNRVNPDFFFKWLADPPKYRPDTKMPAFFPDEYSGPDDILDGDEKKQIAAIREFLMSIGAEGETSRDTVDLPEVKRSEGRALVMRLNCVGCHEIATLPPGKKVGPNLTTEGSRVKKTWLTNFLRKPYSISPEYELMGSHARMPTFSFTEEELLAVVEYISEVLVEKDSSQEVRLEPAWAARGKILFREKRCDNCHRIGRRPGGIGPVLTDAGERLRPDWVVNFIQKPSHYLETRMPNLKVNEQEAKALASYILSPKN